MLDLSLSLPCQIENSENCPSVAQQQYLLSLVVKGEISPLLMNKQRLLYLDRFMNTKVGS